MKAKRNLSIILGVVLLLAIGVGFITLGNQTASAKTSQGPVGAWVVNVSPDGGPSFVDVASFASDGTMTVMENGVAGVGTWRKNGPNTYAFTFRVLIDPDLDPGGTYSGKVDSTIKLSKDGETYSGPFFTTMYDQAGNVLFTGSGTGTGQRMHVDPMP